ncbi:MAG: hypothetical protein WDO56_27500 [Gammaproteobacteria bacterium]
MNTLACRSSLVAAVLRGLAGAVLAAAAISAAAQTPPPGTVPVERRPGITGERLKELAHAHEGLGALAPENLAKKRPKPPFDLTSTWFVDLTRAFADFRFGPPYPELYEAGQTAMKEAAAAAKSGQRYRDSIGECYPAGMPMIMTRVWPISMVQLPTVIYMMFGFNNSIRIIYLDGRQHSDPDIVVSTYNGESIGHWEKDTLVVDTRYFEPNEHYIDSGIPISDEFQMIERMKLVEGGKVLQIEYTMTDPKNWKGEWKNTKRWLRMDNSDIPESECLPNMNKNLPSTAEGSADVDARQKALNAAPPAPPPAPKK